MMTHKDIEACATEVQEILAQYKDRPGDGIVRDKLKDLAIRAGASQLPAPGVSKDADVPQLIYNIHQALQTWSVIDACRTAAKHYIVAVAAAIIAVIAAGAAWAAVIVHEQPNVNSARPAVLRSAICTPAPAIHANR